jgi:transcriptional regulator with PAS, ATPase and Fis domain
MVGAVIFEFLDYLVGAALENKDIPTLIRAYSKLIEKICMIESSKLWDLQLICKGNLGIVLENLINDPVNEKENHERIIIRHPKMFKAFTDALSYSFDNEPCLIIGETGSGKERIAEILHGFSSRRNNNYRAVNCGGFTDTLFKSEIQGFVKGSFTGAFSSRLGVFLSACGKVEKGINYGYNVESDRIVFKTIKNKTSGLPTAEELKEVSGTVFLDEINSLDISLQASLLRIIQEQEVQVVGEDKSRKIDVKVVGAINDDPKILLRDGVFREDLYHRIAKGIIYVPPLRELKDGFNEIIKNFIDRIGKKLGITKKIKINQKAIKSLKAHNWPGNMRELENVLYRAIKRIEVSGEDTINLIHIENLINIKTHDITSQKIDFSKMKYDELRKEYLSYIYSATNGNQSKAEELSGISRATIARDWEKYGLYQTRKRYSKEKEKTT